jgi:hypothetical protein
VSRVGLYAILAVDAVNAKDTEQTKKKEAVTLSQKPNSEFLLLKVICEAKLDDVRL